MIVDDDRGVLDLFTRALGRLGYPVHAYSDPVAARDALENGMEVHLLITDKNMPGLDGVSLARHALELDPNTVTVIATGQADVESVVMSLRMGVVDYLLKPVDIEALGTTVHRSLLTRAQGVYHRRLHGRLREEVEVKTAELARQKAELEALMVASFSGLVRLLEARSPHFEGHSQEVARLACATARELGLDAKEVEDVRVAGLLHDIGMITVPDTILNKAQNLTQDEVRRIREHPRLAEQVLRPFAHLGAAADYALMHHERLDGSGYPGGRTGREIPLGAQIVGVTDAFAALVETRPFRQAMSREDAMATLRGAEGSWFASHVLDALEAAVARDG